jgi:hypothetical protein
LTDNFFIDIVGTLNHGIKLMSRFNLTHEHAADIMTTAIEGGVNYWCSSASYMDDELCSQIIESSDSNYPVYAIPEYWITGGMLLEEDEDGTPHGINLYKLNNALHNEELPLDVAMRILKNDGSADAEDADLIVQVAIFGKVVYG